jgi:hypothetical protein
MRSNRKRNWLIKRIALGFAVAAFVAPVAQASVDVGIPGQPNAPQIAEGSQVTFGPGPHSLPWGYKLHSGDQIELTRVEQPRSTGDSIVPSDYGMPRAMPHDYALSSGDQIEVVRGLPQGTSSDKIEFVRTHPRSTSPELFGRFARPGSTTGDEASWNINWEDAGIGAGLALALVLLGGGAVLVTRHSNRVQTA